MRESITVACGQFQPMFGETGNNIERMIRLAESASADIVVFPELATSGYEFTSREEALELSLEPLSDPEIGKLKGSACDLKCHIAFGFPERADKVVYNSAMFIEPSGRMTVYRKLHLFDREKMIFSAGGQSPPIINTEMGRIGVMICFDWVFPEVARLLALGGAQIIVHPSNLVLQYCQRAMFARSVENGVYTITCNRIGSETRTDRSLTFTGASQILGPRGETLAQASTDREEVITAEIQPAKADDKMITANNHLFSDRRTEFYRNSAG